MIAGFAHTELGWWVANALMLYGALDLLIGLWWLRQRPEMLLTFPRFKRVLPLLALMDAIFIALGLYILGEHYGIA